MQSKWKAQRTSDRGTCTRCGTEVSSLYPFEATPKCTPDLKTRSAPRESAPQATKVEPASQAPVDYFYTDELFDKYPPPADMEIDEDDFAELRSELLGKKMGGMLRRC